MVVSGDFRHVGRTGVVEAGTHLSLVWHHDLCVVYWLCPALCCDGGGKGWLCVERQAGGWGSIQFSAAPNPLWGGDGGCARTMCDDLTHGSFRKVAE